VEHGTALMEQYLPAFVAGADVPFPKGIVPYNEEDDEYNNMISNIVAALPQPMPVDKV
jgi:hypothetical protein